MHSVEQTREQARRAGELMSKLERERADHQTELESERADHQSVLERERADHQAVLERERANYKTVLEREEASEQKYAESEQTLIRSLKSKDEIIRGLEMQIDTLSKLLNRRHPPQIKKPVSSSNFS